MEGHSFEVLVVQHFCGPEPIVCHLLECEGQIYTFTEGYISYLFFQWCLGHLRCDGTIQVFADIFQFSDFHSHFVQFHLNIFQRLDVSILCDDRMHVGGRVQELIWLFYAGLFHVAPVLFLVRPKMGCS